MLLNPIRIWFEYNYLPRQNYSSLIVCSRVAEHETERVQPAERGIRDRIWRGRVVT